MADAWDGRPQNPERDGWHWLHHPEDLRPIATPWIAGIEAWSSGSAHSPQGVVDLGWRYLGPCLLPAEVAALVEAAGEEMREACVKACDGHADTLAVNGISVTSVSVARTCASILVTLPLPTPDLSAIRASARREGMEVAAKIAETDRWARTQKQIATAIRAAMEQEDGE